MRFLEKPSEYDNALKEDHVQPSSYCPDCGTKRPHHSPQGLCPKCLLDAGLDEPVSGRREAATLITDPADDASAASLPATDPVARGQEDSPRVGTKIKYVGDYEILEEIARGGMGVVYKARQLRLDRTVALKMILSGHFAGKADVQRFQIEAEAAARLDHPNIVPIYEVGEHDGVHYFSMGYVDGESLAERLSDGPWSPQDAAELTRTLGEAIAFAHSQGVIHRDLKPGNVLLDGTGRPRIADFGLARRSDVDSRLTGTGQIVGTPAYMAPEQASDAANVGPPSDVYSLGAVLYELLTGEPPFSAANPLDTVLQVLEQPPTAPRSINSAIPKDLEAICLKCLEKRSEHRYQTADDLARDLTRFLENEPVEARSLTALTRLYRWCDRNIGKMTMIAIGFLLILPLLAFVGMGFLFGSWPLPLLLISYPLLLLIMLPYIVGMLLYSTWHQVRRAQDRRGESRQRRERSTPLIVVGGLLMLAGIAGYGGLLIANGWEIPAESRYFLIAFVAGLGMLGTGLNARPYR